MVRAWLCTHYHERRRRPTESTGNMPEGFPVSVISVAVRSDGVSPDGRASESELTPQGIAQGDERFVGDGRCVFADG